MNNSKNPKSRIGATGNPKSAVTPSGTRGRNQKFKEDFCRLSEELPDRTLSILILSRLVYPLMLVSKIIILTFITAQCSTMLYAGLRAWIDRA